MAASHAYRGQVPSAIDLSIEVGADGEVKAEGKSVMPEPERFNPPVRTSWPYTDGPTIRLDVVGRFYWVQLCREVAAPGKELVVVLLDDLQQRLPLHARLIALRFFGAGPGASCARVIERPHRVVRFWMTFEDEEGKPASKQWTFPPIFRSEERDDVWRWTRGFWNGGPFDELRREYLALDRYDEKRQQQPAIGYEARMHELVWCSRFGNGIVEDADDWRREAWAKRDASLGADAGASKVDEVNAALKDALDRICGVQAE
jgi:hypothetical protein